MAGAERATLRRGHRRRETTRTLTAILLCCTAVILHSRSCQGGSVDSIVQITEEQAKQYARAFFVTFPDEEANTGSAPTERNVAVSDAALTRSSVRGFSIGSGTGALKRVDESGSLEGGREGVDAFVLSLRAQGRFIKFLDLFESTGMNSTVAQLLPKMGVTLVVPDDAAFEALSEAQRKTIKGSRRKRLQLAAFHVWAGASTFSALIGHPPQTKYSTADFPQKGIGAYKLISSDPSTLEFSGRPDAKTGAKVTSPDLFLDSRDGHIIVAHAIDHVLFPSRFF